MDVFQFNYYSDSLNNFKLRLEVIKTLKDIECLEVQREVTTLKMMIVLLTNLLGRG